MSTEKQNLAGKLAALAQKNGSKPLVKIIGGVCAGIIALVALCSIFGDSSGVAAVKKHVWKEYDETVTFEEAVARFCEKTSVDEDFTEDKPCRGKKRDYSTPEWTDSGATSTGARVVTLKIPFMETGYKTEERWRNINDFKKEYPSAEVFFEKKLEFAGIRYLTVGYKCAFSYTVEFVVSSDGKVSVRNGSVKAIYNCTAK